MSFPTSSLNPGCPQGGSHPAHTLRLGGGRSGDRLVGLGIDACIWWEQIKGWRKGTIHKQVMRSSGVVVQLRIHLLK